METIEFKKTGFWKQEYNILVDGQNTGSARFQDFFKNKMIFESGNERWQIQRKGFLKSSLLVTNLNTPEEYNIPLAWRFNCSVVLNNENYSFRFEGFWKQMMIWENGNGIRILICEKPNAFNLSCKYNLLESSIKDRDAVLLSMISFYIHLLKRKAAHAAV